MSKLLLLLVLVGMLVGCGTFGHQVNVSAIKQIELGKTTESAVISMFGVPEKTKKLDNGIVVFEYYYGKKVPFNGTTYDYLQVQFYNGISINKWKKLVFFG